MPETELRLYTRPGGSSMSLDALIQIYERKAQKAEDMQRAQRRVLEGAKFPVGTPDFQKAVTEVGITIGEQLAYEGVVKELKALRVRLIELDGRSHAA